MRLQQGKEENGKSIILFMILQVSLGKGEKFPFLSVVTYGGQEYIGIINNQDSFITSMYIFTDLLT